MHRAHSNEVSIDCSTLAAAFDARVSATPDALAYASVLDDLRLGLSWTYADLADRARALAATLQERTEPGEAVLLAYAPGLEFVRAFWACQLAGVVPVPVPPLDASRLETSLERMRTVGVDCRARITLCDARTSALVRVDPSSLTHEHWIATDELAETQGPFRTHTNRDGNGLAYVQYTSGSTSEPRGVMVRHANVLANCHGMSAALAPDESSKVLSWLPHFHDYGLVGGIVWPLVGGVPSYLMSPNTFLRRPLRWLEAIDRLGITFGGAPNFAYEACIQARLSNPEWDARLDRWRAATCGAEPIRAETARRFTELFAGHGLDPLAFTPAYGLAEVTVLASVKRRDRPYSTLWLDRSQLAQRRVALVDERHADAQGLVGCGAPIVGLQVRVVDPERGVECAPDTVGELWIAGSSVAGGYHGRPDETARTFGQTVGDHCGYLRSGDLGFLLNGEVFVTGRLKDLLIVNGRNVYPQDIEWTCEHACDGLRAGHGAAIAVDAASAAGSERIVLVQEVERRAQQQDLPRMAADIRRAIAHDHDVAIDSIVLVKAGTLARTSSGKVQRQRCLDDYLSQRLQALWVDAHAPSDPPLDAWDLEWQGIVADSDVRTCVLQRVADLTGRAPAALNTQASCVENGLDSLGAFRLLEALASTFRVTLAAADVLGATSLDELVQRVELARSERAHRNLCATPPPSLPEADGDTSTELSLQQQGVWIAERLHRNAQYHLAQATRLRGPLDVSRLLQSLRALMTRHEVLRSCLSDTSGQVSLQPQPTTALDIAIHDLSSLGPEQRWPQSQQLVEDFARRPFELERAPLLRIALWRLGEDDWVLAVVVHHLIFDGTSAALLMQEWARLYEFAGETSSEHRHPALYAHFVAWQQRWLADEAVRRTVQTLRARLAGTPVLELPTDRARPAQPSHLGATHRFEIDQDLVRAARQLAARENATLFMLLMGGFQTLLMRISGQQDFAIAMAASARPGERFRHTIGLFTNTVVLRADAAGDPPFADMLTRMRRGVTLALEHQCVPFDLVAGELQVDRDPRRHMLFQAGMSLQSMGGTALHLPGLHCEELPLHNGCARTDLWLTFTEVEGRLHGELEYATDLFDVDSVQSLARCFTQLLRSALEDPSAPLSRLSLLSNAERELVLEQWNATERDHPLQWCLHQLIEQQVQRSPQRVAVAFGEDSLTYLELERRANQLAHHLRALGVGPEVLVGVCLRRSMRAARDVAGRAQGRVAPTCRSIPSCRRNGWNSCCATPARRWC